MVPVGPSLGCCCCRAYYNPQLPVTIIILYSRWKHTSEGKRFYKNDKPVLEFVAIKRKDSGIWAIPGVSEVIIALTMISPLVWMF